MLQKDRLVHQVVDRVVHKFDDFSKYKLIGYQPLIWTKMSRDRIHHRIAAVPKVLVEYLVWNG